MPVSDGMHRSCADALPRLPVSWLGECRHWVFDMDGTLTVAVHDFALIRRELGIPEAHDILEHLTALDADEAAACRAWLMAHERELALAAQPAPGALDLLQALHEAGCRLGVLTRNAGSLAWLTLQAIGVDGLFRQGEVIGRDDAVPKPDPDGLLRLAARWEIPARQLVMVGDYRFDLECGRAAGAATLLVNQPQRAWPELADWQFRDCAEVLQAWRDEVATGEIVKRDSNCVRIS